MKNKFLSVVILACSLFLMFSCGKKNLDIEPRNELPTEYAIENPELMLKGIYSLLGSGGIENIQEGALYGTDLILVPDLLAGEKYMSWSGTFSQYRQVRNKTMISTNIAVVRIWRKAYLAINLANTLLSHLPAKNGNIYKAQALFARGILHFEIVRLYAKQYDLGTSSTELGVPLVLSATQSFDDITSPSRASVEDVYKQIIQDLTEAESLLQGNDSEIISSSTISAFLSRVYLQKGDYLSALTSSNKVIMSGGYTLENKITDVFNTNGSKEHIFVIEQTQNKNTGTANDGLTTYFGCDGNIPAGTGRGDVSISNSFVEKYDSLDERRRGLIYNGTCTKESVTSGKWKDPYKNIPVLRLAEMLLTRAECNFRLGSAVGASPLADLNTIRKRSGATMYQIESVTLDTILLERDFELAFEGIRIHDRKRVNASFLDKDKNGNPISTFYRDAKFVLPIPQVEINSNKSLVQNEGY